MPLIDTEVLANWIDGSQRLDTEHDYDEVARYIEECPTVDAVPVVRCWECIHNYANMIPGGEGCAKCVELPITPDFYCKNGERKGGNE